MLTAMSLGAALLVAGAGGAAWARRRWIVVAVQGNSMSPTLHDGQRLVARRLDRSNGYARSDVVVFLMPAAQRATLGDQALPYLVKRLAAVAGDPVPDWARAALGADSETRVPPGKVVVSGDNAVSQDSRQLGYIDAETLIAVVRR
ncbi:S26 family signal peptidase [Corallococcus exiguus]|uniref:Signal peptidase I n=2 Tax=Corallococcus exiguus TaxID=83462 RepID=A0A7X4Y7L3_9BACT|nr:S26 family signal peptidase [Corallococcus exiguus]TNV60932.1 S26 family signal peptidase [Corallococcus exiguus]